MHIAVSFYAVWKLIILKKIDSTKCNKEFPSFLVKQNKLIDKIKLEGDPTNNFGLKDILALEHKNVA